MRVKFCNVYFEYEIKRGHRFENYHGPIEANNSASDCESLSSLRHTKSVKQTREKSSSVNSSPLQDATRSSPSPSTDMFRSRTASSGVEKKKTLRREKALVIGGTVSKRLSQKYLNQSGMCRKLVYLKCLILQKVIMQHH